jgi:hypothetical protein
VNQHLSAFLALYLAQERVKEANHYRLAAIAAEGRPPFSTRLRRSLAQALAALSRGSASIVRKLDRCIADDLGRTLAPTE